ncbi:hypothetical protein JCM3263A_14970 [Thermobifida fusca]|jgi:hypothetical protein|uniref:Secreted protein n=2 Tax=Thermobifida fusca TaxID=2021 RepID=A0A9P2WRK3_THEFU|nr:hypothetical protein [Thermobifida fusca]AAZ54255.1 hypothetical protein Tfu_0217 [Thermobifida fusca YX]MBO2529876.1 hypothetical protein [Thermobifida sp.]EOR72677.1 hypothetical protein TM51_01418 [Thermobifida fusca TM51]MDD6791889.1 hypothetical protein [Thermobifida fusca]PPS94014.1 hypothetical protein BH05_06505 [Thermobifida fusca]
MLRVLLASLLICAAALLMPAPASGHSRAGRVSRQATPAETPRRQARIIPQRIPNYAEFAACAEQHSALWEITYEYGNPRPYTARNRVTGHTVAVDDLDLLDHILGTYEPPHPVRGYYGQQVVGGGA